MKYPLSSEISHYQEAQAIIVKTKSSAGEGGIRFDGKLIVVKGK